MTTESFHKTILQEEFEEPFKGLPMVYEWGKRVRRDNFASLLGLAFGIAAGNPQRHREVFETLVPLAGFNYIETLGNFKRAGGIFCLNKEESDLLYGLYRGVSEHESGEKGRFLYRREFQRAFNQQMKLL